MLATLFSLTALLSAALLMLLGNGLLGSLLGLKLTQAGAGPLATAMVMTGFYAGLVTGAQLGSKAIRRVGHIRAFAAACSVNVTTTLLLTLTTSASLWAVLRFGTGISMMASYMVIESWLNERSEASMRGRVFSIYQVVTYLAIGGSQFLLGLDAESGHRLLVVSALLFSICLLPIALTKAVIPAPLEKADLNLKALFSKAPHAFYGCLAAGLLNGAFYALGPTYIFSQTGDASSVGVFMGVTIFGGLLLQWPLGLLSDRYKRRRIMQVLGLATAITSLLLLLTGQWLFVELGVALIWGGLAFTIYPIAVAYANDRIETDELVPAAGALLIFYGVGAATGPLLAGLSMKVGGAQGLYLFCALIGLVLTLLVAQRRGADKVSVADQGDYVPVTNTSTVITQLDPRSEEEEEMQQGDEPPHVEVAETGGMALPPEAANRYDA